MATTETSLQFCTNCERETEWSLRQEAHGRIHRCDRCNGTQYRSGGLTISGVRQPAGTR